MWLSCGGVLAQMSSRILLVPLIGDIWGFPKIRGTLLEVPIIRTIVFWGLHWGPPILGNYHMVPNSRYFTDGVRRSLALVRTSFCVKK